MKSKIKFESSEEIDGLLDGLKKLPLKNRLHVINHVDAINLITYCGFRENKMWTDDEEELSQKMAISVQKHTNNIIEIIKEWENDGRP